MQAFKVTYNPKQNTFKVDRRVMTEAQFLIFLEGGSRCLSTTLQYAGAAFGLILIAAAIAALVAMPQ
jgi:hypothetical protein